MNLRVAKKISKNATKLNYGKTQIAKAETTLRRSQKNGQK